MNELDPRIRIRAPLRCDGIGRFDCAEDAVSGGRMAVRWLPLEANGDAAARACEKLPSHPTLPRIRQTGQMGGAAFVAMDFPNGHLLSTVEGERFDIEMVLSLGAQLADALAAVHAQGVVHGELGAESVLLVPPDRAYLWDMPLVIANRMSDRRGENRMMQTLVRIAPYLSPERARGEGASQAADVYSLGSILCVAAGAPMPVAPTTLGVVHLVSTGAWEVQVPSSLPEGARAMLERMVSVNPAARPTAREAAEAFGLPISPAGLPTLREMPAVQLPPLPAPSPVRAAAAAEPPVPVAEAVVEAVVTPVAEPATDLSVVTPALVARQAEVRPAVSLTATVSVHADLADAGAHTIDDAMPLAEEMRSHRRLWVAGSVMVGAVVALASVALKLAADPVAAAPAVPAAVSATVKPLPAAPLVEVAPVAAVPVAAAKAAEVSDDELAPLPSLPSLPRHRAFKGPMKPSRIAAPQQPATAPAHEAEASAPKHPDFNFLEDAPPPTSELKRPQL